jgi:hypothetical protein
MTRVTKSRGKSHHSQSNVRKWNGGEKPHAFVPKATEVVLMVAGTVGEICPEVFGLNGANREVFGDFEINASACTHREGVLGRVDDGPASAEQGWANGVDV